MNPFRSASLGIGAAIMVNLFVGASRAAKPQAITNAVAMAFVDVPAGEFLMGAAAGDSAAEADERPTHRVRIVRSFQLGKYEVTQRQYRAVMGDDPSWFSPQGGGRDEVRGIDADQLPVDMVSWDEAVEFCRRLSELPAERAAGRTYRLPTEAEWEYAARAGSQTSPPAGANIRDSAAVESATRAVGSYRPNAWGLFDMQGNVWEWCADHYDADYYAHSSADDPQGPTEGTGHVVRGGDFRSSAAAARVCNRDFTRASRRDLGNGFRVVLEQNLESSR